MTSDGACHGGDLPCVMAGVDPWDQSCREAGVAPAPDYPGRSHVEIGCRA